MSRISQDFINSVGYLYEEINIQQNDFLNEESEYYDAEAAEIVEDILATISTSMVYEGYSVEAIIGFLSDSSEETIIEKYLSFDENVLLESNVSDEYIEEQFQQLNEIIGAALRIAGAGLKAAKYAKGAKGLAPLTRLGSGLQGAGKAASRVAQQGAKASAMVRPALSKGVQKAKDIAQGAKKALPGIAKGAGIFGLGAAGGYVGAKMAGAGSGEKSAESPKPSTKTPAPAAPKLPPVSSSSGGGSASSGGGARRSKPVAPVTSKQTGDKAKDMATWAKANPKLAAKLNPDGTQKGTGQSEMEKSAEELRQMVNRSKQRQGALMGGPEGPGKIDTKSVDAAIKAEQEKQKQKLQSQKNTSMTAKESYEPYDVILNYLLSEGHADTVDEANYIMLEMDETAVGTIIEEYEDYLLAEEIQEWVNSLLDEGYDFSEYSWDDVVEYYVTEAKYGTAKGRKKLAKKVRAGKDVGKKGAGFEAIVDKASGKYGKKRATKIAAAAMWKNLGK